MEPLLDATRPRTSLGTLFTDTEVAALRAWVRSATPQPALATAPPGTGLSTLARLLASEADLEIIVVTTAMPRTRAFLTTVGANPLTVTMRRKLLLIDEVESADAPHVADALAFVRAASASASGLRVPVLFLGKATRAQKAYEFAKAWPKFAFARPSTARVGAYLAAIAAKFAVDVDVAALASAAKGDVRAALMAMDMHRRGQAPHIHARPNEHARQAPRLPDLKDEALDGLDLVDDVLHRRRGGTVRDALRLYSQAPCVASMGVYENYPAAVSDIADAAAVARWFADADVVAEYIGARQAWDMHEVHGACALAGPAAVVHRARAPPKNRTSKTYGTALSKAHTACAKTKHVRLLAAARAERGLPALGVDDLAHVRAVVRALLAQKREAELAEWWKPLGAPELLALARLDSSSVEWYKQSTHARMKKLLSV